MTCEACGGGLQHEAAEIELRIGQRVVAVAQPGWYCWQCGAARFSAEDLAIAERNIRVAGLEAAAEAIKSSARYPRPAKAA